MVPERPRILVVEDEVLIGVLLQQMLDELGCECLGPIIHLNTAVEHAGSDAFDAAILDLIIHGEHAYPVADILVERGIPFGFASGVPRGGLDRKWASYPFLAKPFLIDDVRTFVTRILTGSGLLSRDHAPSPPPP